MGLFKQMKDMKNMVEQAPGMIAQGQQLAAQAQEMAVAQQAAAQQAAAQAQAANTAAAATGAGDFTPINGVTIEQYATLCKQLGAGAGDAAQAHAAAAAYGISPADWDAASAGWGARMQSDRVVGTKFRDLYLQG
ncbi:hypothetical protein ABIE44_001828 [Marmoricola sp. OAE513]|uniref:hypothetical protein n=1 Tax=Marmoricola sp. OAE513 TaxID=2817894 RepID=UPI001AE26C52